MIFISYMHVSGKLEYVDDVPSEGLWLAQLLLHALLDRHSPLQPNQRLWYIMRLAVP
jgi:hypothetical protein